VRFGQMHLVGLEDVASELARARRRTVVPKAFDYAALNSTRSSAQFYAPWVVNLYAIAYT